ncbi:DUF4019 domain-containing protein [Achromobacter mucicolens]|uniref:DUF4019 domain-containing protein n=1 Tax=Achromobacter mucicolens TaxID=1389922 RepID=A0ABM8LIZ7_9BURK|nr:DUF4019 domain-containing protein [Achromobacter mucicolens]MCP2517274.1 DUF4019 domain-containing protein [Achromobacter mucicolens]CAB3901332.1 hypothetical protein LMG3415_04480 [Achromobacter mucicolens]
MNEHIHRSDKGTLIAAFTFGVVFVIAIILIAIFRPTPTEFEYTIFRIVIALAAAGVGAVLPGFLDVNFRNWLRAGGALAIFVVVYFFSPVGMTTVSTEVTPPKVDAKPAADEWLNYVDHADYQKAYDSMAKSFRDTYPYAQFDDIIGRTRGNLGIPINRKVYQTAPFFSPPGSKKGAYMQYIYETTFAGRSAPIYETILLFGEDGKWFVNGFLYAIKKKSGSFAPYDPASPP